MSDVQRQDMDVYQKAFRERCDSGGFRHEQDNRKDDADDGSHTGTKIVWIAWDICAKAFFQSLSALLEKAENEEASFKRFLLDVLETEVKGRNERRRKRNYAAAISHQTFIPSKNFIPLSLNQESRRGNHQLKELTWLDTCGNIVLAGAAWSWQDNDRSWSWARSHPKRIHRSLWENGEPCQDTGCGRNWTD